MKNLSEIVESTYQLAKDRYAAFEVDVEAAMEVLGGISLSLQCWQGDDVAGFENSDQPLGGGLAVTGNYPGKATTPEELRADLAKALSLIPGKHRVNLHASYGEFGDERVDRDEIEPKHFAGWIAWAKEQGLGLDFNPTCFAHPRARDGFTLSHADIGVREFWITHCQRARLIGAAIGKALEKPCITNVWVPDGSKDTPADRKGPRERLASALDQVFKKKLDPKYNLDAVEPKLFGLGAESYTVGSHEFYLGYAITRKKLLCLDAGHFHPTESLADKLSSVLQFLPEIMLHASRGVRWDSDHVVTYTDELTAIAREICANDYLGRVHIGLDYFDASINRVAAWTIGSRNVLRALLFALLETPIIRMAEEAGDLTSRLAFQEEAKGLPFGAVWDYYCLKQGAPVGAQWIKEVQQYEDDVQSNR
ncbi:MAG TPA: L-rhamnose isomerase [Candidatus Limnocylindria bacterium]|nr:L-rhamnose isomerase [Candidatus Limnocylindria bacterium]